MLSSIVSFVAGYVIGFIYVWKLTLVMLGMFPLIVIVGAAMAKVGHGGWGRSWWDVRGKEGRQQEPGR